MNIMHLYHLARSGRAKDVYWHFAKTRERKAKLKRSEHRAFLRHVRSETAVLRANLKAMHDGILDIDKRLAAAVDWILRAQAATGDAGVSQGYFPLSGGWRAAYPETTGYIVSTLLAYAASQERSDVRDAALQMAQWETEVQMPSGAVQGGTLVSAELRTPAAFNTGMVLDGWCSAYQETGEVRYLESATAAARFLTSDMDDDGFFRTNGDFVSQESSKTYNCLCAWAMLRLARLTEDQSLERAAVRAVEGALSRQTAMGWFSNNCLDFPAIPLTHTIGYTLQGVLEVGILSGREDFIAAARNGVLNVLSKQRSDGFLAGRFDKNWTPAAGYVCLTGSAQIAVVAYRLADFLRDAEFVALADRILQYVAATQRLEGDDPGLVGGIAGSFPILGGYMTAGFPNWASKYFIDALLLRRKLTAEARSHSTKAPFRE